MASQRKVIPLEYVIGSWLSGPCRAYYVRTDHERYACLAYFASIIRKITRLAENVFVLVEDPVAPQRSDLLAQQLPEGQTPIPLTGPGAPTHYRATFLTLSPPGALEQLLAQLNTRWQPVRQSAGMNQFSQTAGQQLSVDGFIYAIGTDFLVRAGNVILAGGAVKGMLLEVRLVPTLFKA